MDLLFFIPAIVASGALLALIVDYFLEFRTDRLYERMRQDNNLLKSENEQLKQLVKDLEQKLHQK